MNFSSIQLQEEKLKETRENELPRLRQEAIDSGEPMNAQLVNDFEESLNRFEKNYMILSLVKPQLFKLLLK